MSAPSPAQSGPEGQRSAAPPVNLLGEGSAEGLPEADDAVSPEHEQEQDDEDADAEADPGAGAGAGARAAGAGAGAAIKPRRGGAALSKAQRKNARRRAAQKAARAAELEANNEHAFANMRVSAVQGNDADFASMRVADGAGVAAPHVHAGQVAPPGAAPLQYPADLPPLYPGPPGWIANPLAFWRQHMQADVRHANPALILNHVSQFVRQRQMDERFAYLNSLYAQPGRPTLMNVRAHQALHREAGLILPDAALRRFPPNKLVQRMEAVQAARTLELVPPPFVLPSGPGIGHQRSCSTCGRPCLSECQCGESYCSDECQIAEWVGPHSHRNSCEVVSQSSPMAMLLTKLYWHHRAEAEDAKEEEHKRSVALLD